MGILTRSLATAALAVVLAGPLHAIQDSNSNGLSDVWEKFYNNDNLFPAASPYLAAEDPDGDGWSNADEAVAGTNPFSSALPEGWVRKAIQSHPEVNGCFMLSWPSIAGKGYQLSVSTNLVDWADRGEVMAGTGAEIELALDCDYEEGGAPKRMFWRVRIADSDPDGDNLTTWEELELETDPNHPDSDLDGIIDGLDAAPLTALPTDTAIQLIAATSRLEGGAYTPIGGTYYETYITSDPNEKDARLSLGWSITFTYVTPIGTTQWTMERFHVSGGSTELYSRFVVSRETPEGVNEDVVEDEDEVRARYQGGSPHTGVIMQLSNPSWGYPDRIDLEKGSAVVSPAKAAIFYGAGSFYPGGNWSQFWLRTEKAVTEETTKSYLVVARSGPAEASVENLPIVGTGQVTLTIGADKKASTAATVNLTGTAAQWVRNDGSGVVHLEPPVAQMGEVNVVDLLPVEILVPEEDSTSSGYVPDDLVSTDKLKVAKWEDAFSTPGGTGGTPTPDQDFNESDVDRFYVKVPMPWKEGEGTATVKIKTDNDPENEIKVVEIPNQPGTFRTNGLILVSDEVDDTFDNLDEGLQDTTHRVKLGDSITFTVDVPNGNPVTFEATVPARAEIELTVKSYSATGVRSSGAVDDAVEAIEAAYAQVGIRVNPSVSTDLGWPVNTLNDGVLNIYNMGANGDALSWRQEYLDFIDTDPRGVGSDFRLFFVRSVGELGIAVNREDLNQLQEESLDNLQDFHEYTDNAFVSDGMAQKYFTPAHELLHLMILELYGDNGGHSTVETDLIRAAASGVNSVGATKRISQEQEDYIYQHSFVKPVEE
ncbi:MAG: hypothetical protein O3A87_02540 [Verrucomicrobia bacterium]|nr:hypothetical protein [Verrucomicrobiota bacterium]